MSLFRPDFDLEPYTYRGARLHEIAFLLGGMATGTISLDGRGGLRDWEIYNRPNKGSLLETTFPALWVRPRGRAATALCCQGPRVRDWMGEGKGFWSLGQGKFFNQMDGLPHFDEAEFSGSFPFARVRFHKGSFPIKAELCAFNPFIPLDVRSSSIPGACLVYRVENTSDVPVDFSMMWTMMNPIGEGRPAAIGDEDRAHNLFADHGPWRGIEFSNDRFGQGDSAHGTAVLATNWKDVTVLPQWDSAAWWDGVQAWWTMFRDTGRVDRDGVVLDGRRSSGSLGCLGTLAPGESAEIPFFIGWNFPVAIKYWGGENEPKANPWKPFYAAEWATVGAAATEFFERYEELRDRTLAFENALFTSTLPPEVIESVASTASILHSTTVLRLEDGTFWAWEGCSPNEGCCAGSCSHVWNYALTHAHLFPEMQRSMSQTEYKYSFNCGPMGKEGALDFRVMLPLGSETKLWHAASDGQLGGVVQLYRDWRLTGDDNLLKELWPSARRALEFAWVQWDRDKDGFVDGDMHNTYDINFQGPNPLTQFFYMAALRAGEEICRHLGDSERANVYRVLHEKGRVRTEKELFNGEFFIQTLDCTTSEAPKYQHGTGCLTDQVFGQLCASLAGLGDLVDPLLVRKALGSIFQFNFRDPLGEHENLQRVYAVSDETGLLLCSWPNGGRPAYPFVYSDEVWTGIEYQVATHLALIGMVDQSMMIVRGVRKRYDGTRRNPYNEFECGSHYARALASYGLLLAFSGFRYDGHSRTATLSPRLEGVFRCFFCTPHGWGIAEHEGGQVRFKAVEGQSPRAS